MMIQNIYRKIEKRCRISKDETLFLAHQGDFLTLASLADEFNRLKNGQRAAYLVDRNINYTNVCAARCNFCAFYRPLNHRQGYDLTFEEIDKKIEETLAMGGTRILMQGGLHPDHTLDTYIRLVQHIKTNHPIHLHAFSPPEIHHVAAKAGLTYHKVMERLKNAGLDSMPGGGAEILVDAIRQKIMTGKCTAQQWLSVMEASHQMGIRTTATMMMGHIERWEERIKHLDALRKLQDRTGGFLSFIPWTFQPENNAMNPRIQRNQNVKLAGPHEYLRLLALSRIYLDNFDHIQVSLLTQGAKTAQIGLHFGADDLGSLLIEENVVRMAGRPQETSLEREKMTQLIRTAGLAPYERDTYYNEITPLKPLREARVITESHQAQTP